MIYSRQVNFLKSIESFDEKNFQNQIKNKKIVIVGCGGVGSVICELLVRGGFLNLTIVDNDLVDKTNIQRQIFFENDIGEAKVNALEKYLKKINKKSQISRNLGLLDEKNVDEICEDCDLIIDATDNFETRRLINLYSEKNKKSWIYNGAVKSEVMCMLFRGEDKLFNRVFNDNIEDESCCEVGVLASTTFISASICYSQVLKFFLGVEDKKLIKFDYWKGRYFEVKMK